MLSFGYLSNPGRNLSHEIIFDEGQRETNYVIRRGIIQKFIQSRQNSLAPKKIYVLIPDELFCSRPYIKSCIATLANS